MPNRTNPYMVPGNLLQPFIDFSNTPAEGSTLEPSIAELVKIRASQVNGCAMCLNMHTRDARKAGETEARLYLLDAWRDSPLYSERERAAIAWTEALTRMDHRAMEEAYELVAAQFTPAEQVRLNLLIGVINVYNRINAGDARAGAAESFEPCRPRLVRVAYRMLGSMADAEDVVQDAFLRWLDIDRTAVATPEAYLVRVVTRLCLDVLKSARRRRETYVGPWLPEPVVEAEPDLDDDVTLPLLLALERLSPLERAAFLLHDLFGLPFDEVAASIGRDTAAVRQLAARARQHVHEARPRFAVDAKQGQQIAAAFFAASQKGDMAALKSMLAADVVFTADGGGKRPAGPAPIVGIDAVLGLLGGLGRMFARTPSRLVRYATINGLPGLVTIEPDGLPQTTAFDIRDGRIAAVYVMRNPDKLQRLDATLH